MKRKILHVSSVTLSSGGMERFLLGLSKSLQDEFDFALLSKVDDIYKKEVENHHGLVYEWKVSGLFDRSASKMLGEVIAHYQPDIIHFHDARARLLSFFMPRLMRGRKIYTTHLPPYYYRWKQFQRIRSFIYGLVEGTLNRWYSDFVVFPSRFGLDYALHHRIASVRNAVCIPNGIDLKPFESADVMLRHNDGKTPIICTVARLNIEKNVSFLFDAATILKNRGCQFQLWVVGDGPEKFNLEKLASQLDILALTRFMGRQSSVESILLQADIFILTSWYEGGRSQAVMEAQAAGLPCVLSNVGDNGSMVDEGRGFLFNEGDLETCVDSLEFLLNNPHERMKIGIQARDYALSVYSLKSMSDAYRNLYRQLVRQMN